MSNVRKLIWSKYLKFLGRKGSFWDKKEENEHFRQDLLKNLRGFMNDHYPLNFYRQEEVEMILNWSIDLINY